MSDRSERGGAAPGVEPLDQRRVSVVCRSTRVDLSLPAHLELVTVIPEIVELIRDHIRKAAGPTTGVDIDARMGGGTGGSWRLSRMAGGALAVSETLAQQRVHDGEILVLDHRPVPTPAPLFDDVLHALTDPEVARSPTWGRGDTVTAATVAAGVMATVAAAALTRQWWHGAVAIASSVALALALLGLFAVLAMRQGPTPRPALAVAGVSTVGFSTLAATFVAAPPLGAGHLVGAFTTGAVLAGVLRCTIYRAGPLGSYGSAAGYLALAVVLGAGALAALVVATMEVPASSVGAGAVLAGLLLLTAAPRIAVTAARIPIPPVPAPGDHVEAGDLEDIDHDISTRAPGRGRPRGPLPTPAVLRDRFLSSRSWLSGLLAAAGIICAAGSLLALTGSAATTRWAVPLALVVTVVLVTRGLGYADRAHTAVLLASALALATGVLVGAVVTLPGPVTVVVPAAVAVSAAVVVAVSVPSHVEPSPAVLRAIGVIEVVAICVIVPLAVGAMEIYSVIRHR